MYLGKEHSGLREQSVEASSGRGAGRGAGAARGQRGKSTVGEPGGGSRGA